MHPRRLTVIFVAQDPARLAQFWAGVLGRPVIADAEDGQLGLRFVPGGGQKHGPNRMHPHLTSTSLADQQHTVTTALELGARHLDVGQRPEEGHVVLADPEGNEFCVIEPDNAFLAGCGLLGELTCDGTRAVGLFWSRALGWPLVWDQGEETAIQSPRGGTKVSWSGDRPMTFETVRQRFALTAPDGDRAAEVDRLVSLGAMRLEAGDDGVLADPDGSEFRVLTT